jgi:hypothetical protein
LPHPTSAIAQMKLHEIDHLIACFQSSAIPQLQIK